MATTFHNTPRPSGLRVVLDWLHGTAREANRISGMSQRELDDIGVKSGSLSSAVHRDIGRVQLVDFGWRLGR